MDLDLTLVRSFVLTAEHLHFGSAAAQLRVSQQALSKRIRRLEDVLSVSLFVRDTRHVSLTPAGQRFLPYAKDLLATADMAVLALHESTTRLRVDVLDDRLAPMNLIRHVLADHPELRTETSMRRGLVPAISAMERDEIDIAFGRVHDLGRPLHAHLSHTLVRLEPVHVLVGDEHPLAARPVLHTAELRRAGLWMPNPGSAVEWEAYLLRFAGHWDVPLIFEDAAGTLEELVARIRRERVRVTLTGADMPLPGDTGLRSIPLVGPAPVYPWSLVWPRHLERLTRNFVAAVGTAGEVRRGDDGALSADLTRQWLPAPDLAEVNGASPNRR